MNDEISITQAIINNNFAAYNIRVMGLYETLFIMHEKYIDKCWRRDALEEIREALLR